jgi:hypothetical protein
VLRAGFTVTTLRQSDNSPSRKAPRHQGQKRPDRWKAISTAWSSLSLTSRGLCINRFSQQAKMWIAGSTAKFCGYCVKCAKIFSPTFAKTDLATSPWQRTLSHSRPHLFVSSEKQNCCYPPAIVLPWFGTLWRPSISWNEIQAERTPFRYNWGDPGRNAESDWLTEKGHRKRSKNGEDGGTGVYMREGTKSRLRAADRPYGKFYDLYSVSPENFRSNLVI